MPCSSYVGSWLLELGSDVTESAGQIKGFTVLLLFTFTTAVGLLTLG